MMFKKFAALVLALCLACGTMAMAAEITDKSTDKTTDVNVIYKVQLVDQYTVTIPSSVEVGAAGNSPMVLKIAPAEKYNKANGMIAIKLTSGGAIPFKLTREGGHETIEYLITSEVQASYDAMITNQYNTNTVLLSWSFDPNKANTAVDKTVYVCANIQYAKVAGDYKGSLTFEVTTDATATTNTSETPNNP